MKMNRIIIALLLAVALLSGQTVVDRGTYNSGTTYAVNDRVTFNSNAYVSLQAGNINNTPSSSPTFWALASSTPPGAGSVIHSFGGTFDGGGTALTSGKTVYYTIPYSCTIQGWNITVDTGTATVDIWKVATGTAIPTIANTITASATPAISSGTAVHSTVLTGWTTAVAQNDIVGVNLKAVASATEVSLVVQCQ